MDTQAGITVTEETNKTVLLHALLGVTEPLAFFSHVFFCTAFPLGIGVPTVDVDVRFILHISHR